MQVQPRWTKFAILLPLVAVFIWSLNITVTRYVTDYISPVGISFYRWFVAFILLTPFMLKTVWQQRELIQRYWKQLAVLSAFGMVLYQGLGYAAAHYTTATNMGIINAFIPVFTIAVSFMLLKDIASPYALIGCLISFTGLLFVVAQGDFSNLLQMGGASWRPHDDFCRVLLCLLWGVSEEMAVTNSVVTEPLCADFFLLCFTTYLFLLYLGIDAINMQNAPSGFCGHFSLFNCAIGLDARCAATRAKSNQYFYESHTRFYCLDCIFLVG